MHRIACLTVAWLASLLAVSQVSAYPVGPALSLTDLIKTSDLICKVVVLGSEGAGVSPYKPVQGFDVLSTRLKVIETYKGSVAGNTISFVHYSPIQNGMGFMYMPQNYHFDEGKAYILFAKKLGDGDSYQMLWEHHKSKEDQGLVRAADDSRHGKRPVREVLWHELTKCLKHNDREMTVYAIKQLDWMSGGGYDQLKHFDRAATLQTIAPKMRSQDEEIATLAIQAIGSRNPYLSPGGAVGWLATVGKGHLPGYATWDKPEQIAATEFWSQLAEIADSDRPAAIRALAVRALGLTRVPEVKPHLLRWLDDSEPLVRQSAAVLLADFPDLAQTETIQRLATSDDSPVRIGVAHGIGFGQFSNHIPVLAELLQDPAAPVSAAAAMSLLSFPLDKAKPTLTANLKHPQYRSLFINALALESPADYRDALCDVIENKLCPENWWGGSIPWGVSWNILFKHVQSQPVAELQAGRFDKALSALESPEFFSSSEPRDLYALYLQRGLKDRAKSFREDCRKRITYDIDYYFDMVDKNPDTYQRNR